MCGCGWCGTVCHLCKVQPFSESLHQPKASSAECFDNLEWLHNFKAIQ